MTRVVEINDLESLSACRLLWNALLSKTRGANFFQTLDWLETYWRHFGESQRMRVLVAYAAGEVAGILPLVVRNEKTRLGTMRVLTYPLDDWGTFYGPIGPNPTATLVAGLAHIRRTERDWDILDLRWVDVDHGDHGRTHHAMAGQEFFPSTGPWALAPQIVLEGTWDSYWASRTSRWRNNVRRAEKKLAERGTISCVRYRPLGTAQGDDDPRWDLYEACLKVAERSWQSGSASGTTLTHSAVNEFLRDAHLAATRAGGLDLNLLLLDGQPVAFNYAYHYQGTVYGLRTGFDSTLSSEGAGTVLQQRMIQDSFNRGDRLYDLGAGYLDCKRYWKTRTAVSYRHAYYAPTAWRAQLLRAKRWFDAWRRGPEVVRDAQAAAA